jgi:hypothetical protein
MPPEPSFESRNSPTAGVDDAAKAFFDMEQERKAAVRKLAGIPEEDPAAEPEREPTRLEAELDALVDADPEDPDAEDAPGEPNAELDAQAPDPEADPDPAAPQDEPGDLEIPLEARITLPNGAETSFQDLQEGYMRQQDYTAKTTELGDHRRQFEAKVGEAYQAFDEQVQQNVALATELQAHLESVLPTQQAMEALRKVDPGEYAARMEDMRRKQGAIAQAANLKKNAEAVAASRLSDQQAAQIPVERKALAAAVPAFRRNFDKEYDALSRYAVASDGGGLRPEEWDQVIDHRYVTLVYKAREYDKATRKTAPAVRKAMAKKPRSVRSGSPRDTGETQRSEVDVAMANLKAHPDSRDAAAAVFLARERSKRTGLKARGRRV